MLLSTILEVTGLPLASGTGPQSLGFHILGVELHASRQSDPTVVAGSTASLLSGLWAAVEGVLPSMQLSRNYSLLSQAVQ